MSANSSAALQLTGQPLVWLNFRHVSGSRGSELAISTQPPHLLLPVPPWVRREPTGDYLRRSRRVCRSAETVPNVTERNGDCQQTRCFVVHRGVGKNTKHCPRRRETSRFENIITRAICSCSSSKHMRGSYMRLERQPRLLPACTAVPIPFSSRLFSGRSRMEQPVAKASTVVTRLTVKTRRRGGGD